MTFLQDLYDTLRMSYEISTTYAPPTLDGELWRYLKQFKILVGTPRQATSYGEKRRVVYDNG